MKNNSCGFITEIHNEYGVYGDYILTKYGSLIGAINLSGRDPDSLLPDDHIGLSFVTRNIYEKVDKSITITQYFSHFDNTKVALAKRNDPITNMLSQRLEKYLNNKCLTKSLLIHYFEIFPQENLNKLNLLNVSKHLLSSIVSKKSRTVLKEHFMGDSALIVQLDELERQAFELTKNINEVLEKWKGLMDAKKCSVQMLWQHKHFLANLNSQILEDGVNHHYPIADWDKSIQNGDVNHIKIHNTHMIKINDAIPTYARIASIINFGDKRVMPGIWNIDDEAPLKLNCNYIAMMRWSPLTPLQKSFLFRNKKNQLERLNLNLYDMLTGKEKVTQLDKHLAMKPDVKNKLDELGQAESIDDSWGITQGMFLTFSHDPEIVIKNSIKANKAFGSVGMRVVWESVNLPESFKTIQPSGGSKSERDIYFTSTQLGASSLIYKPSEGQKSVSFYTKEEAQYIFQTTDGAPFYYSPYVGGRSLEICVGPTRSGKSFLKNTLAGHFLKYGGLLRAIDIDPGTEMLAKAFGNDGSIFKLSDGEICGLNPFVSAQGSNDKRFIRHIKSMLLAMMLANDQENLKKLSEDEQDYLDKAILDTLELPKDMQRLGSLVGHMPKHLARKFHRWIHREHDKGMYAELFDASVDSIGELNKRLAVCNLEGIAKDTTALSLVMMDYFYRVTSAFEDLKLRSVPKKLEIDEAHHFLKYPDIVNFITGRIRTWGKYFSGISLWTQSPADYLNIPSWDVLRSSASTFIFMSDLNMDEELYKKTFDLTSGECEQIRNLQPKREAYIVQPDLKISKKVILEVDKVQYVISTSNPIDCTIRNKFINDYGFDEGIKATIAALDARNTESVNLRNQEIANIKTKYYGNG